MRTAEELRQRWVDRLQGLVTGKGISAGTGLAMELILDGMLRDLCFLDDRDSEYRDISNELDSRYGNRGISGRFSSVFHQERCQAEVAAVYAEVFSRLGYITVDQRLSEHQWSDLTAELPAIFGGHDMRQSQIEPTLGPASAVISNRILCYGSIRPLDGWVFVECHNEIRREYDIETGSFRTVIDRNPLVRSVRRSSLSFEEGLLLTRIGELLYTDNSVAKRP